MKTKLLGFILILVVPFFFYPSNSNPQQFSPAIHLPTQSVCASGSLRKEITHGWSTGIGVNRVYYPNGKLKAEYHFELGAVVSSRGFDEEGRLSWESDGPIWDDRTDKFYYPDGKLSKEIVYRYNKILSDKEFNPQGGLTKDFSRSKVSDD